MYKRCIIGYLNHTNESCLGDWDQGWLLDGQSNTKIGKEEVDLNKK